MKELILLRHGTSGFNEENRFSGWGDTSLSECGVIEVHLAGRALRAQVPRVGLACCSLLTRAKQSLDLLLDAYRPDVIPVRQSWRLNERHYGTLEGMNKAEAAQLFGEKQVLRWRRSYHAIPPEVALTDPVYKKMREDPRYADVSALPRAESIEMAVDRAWPFLEEVFDGAGGEDGSVLVVTHGNIIRGLCAKLDGLEGDVLLQAPVPNAVPIVYEIGKNMAARRRAALGPARGIARVRGAA